MLISPCRREKKMANLIKNPPTLPWKIRILTAVLGYAQDLCCRADGTVNQTFLSFFSVLKSHPSAVPIDGVISHDVTYDPVYNLYFRLYVPIGTNISSKLPVVVYFHGGAFFCGSPDMKMIDQHCNRVAAKTHAVVVSVKYRMAPEHRIPAQFEDGLNVLRWLDDKDNIKNFPDCADLSRCFLTGDSCGGNIAHNVAVRVAQNQTFERVRIAGLVTVQPFFGGEGHSVSELRIDAGGVNIRRINTWWKIALPKGSNKDHEAVNIFGPNSTVDISKLNFPPTMVVIGAFDPLIDWQRRYCEGLKDSGKQVCLVEYPIIHGFTMFPELPENSLFITTELKSFIEKH